MGNIAEETGREGHIREMLDTYFPDAGLDERNRLRRRWQIMTDEELAQTEARLEAAQSSD